MNGDSNEDVGVDNKENSGGIGNDIELTQKLVMNGFLILLIKSMAFSTMI